jgi:hypothetical protein
MLLLIGLLMLPLPLCMRLLTLLLTLGRPLLLLLRTRLCAGVMQGTV